MPKFRAFVHGVNLQMRRSDSDVVERLGFYTNGFVEAESPKAAESMVVDLIRDRAELRKAVENSREDPPRIFVEEIADWPAGTARPLTGFALFKEDETEGD